MDTCHCIIYLFKRNR